MLNTNLIRISAFTFMSALAASACGGGGGDDPTTDSKDGSHDSSSSSGSSGSSGGSSGSGSAAQKKICDSFDEFTNDCLAIITGCKYKPGAIADSCAQAGTLTEDALDRMVCGDVVKAVCSDKDFAAECDCDSGSSSGAKCSSGQTCSELESGGGVCTVGTKPPSSAPTCTASTSCASGTACVADAGSTTKGHCLTKCTP